MTPGCARRAGSDAGFTLVELLVSITLFAMLSVLLAGTLRTGSRAAAAGETRIDRTTQIALSETVIWAQLAGALPVTAMGSAALLFDGRTDGVDFIGLPPAYLAPGGFHRLSLALEPTASGQDLVLRWQSLTAAVEDSDLRPSILVEHLVRVDFAYYGARDYAELPQWREEWRGALRLPVLVRLHFVFLDGHEVPDLVVALRLSQAAAEPGARLARWLGEVA
jgi:prepilin-type N-terminal cleavage/methylation domain-containing protein